MNKIFTSNKFMRGQAMTEMVVSFAFVVVPLFLIVPTLGKYIDMKQAAVSSARYAAWERTVSFNADTLANQPSGFTGTSMGNLPQKNDAQLANETGLRVFANASTLINDQQDDPGRFLWTYHDGNAMYQADDDALDVSSNGNTPDKALGATRFIFDAVEIVVAAVSISTVLPFVSQQFDPVHTRGNTGVDVNLSVSAIPTYTNLQGSAAALLNVDTGLTMRAKAGVLSQTWSAGGPAHMKSQAQALAPTKLLGDFFNLVTIPGLGNGQDLIATALLTPEFSSDNLVFGQMDENALPRDKYAVPEFPDVDDADQPLCNEKGYCRE